MITNYEAENWRNFPEPIMKYDTRSLPKITYVWYCELQKSYKLLYLDNI